MRRLGSAGCFVAAIGVIVLFGLADPAFADNCSGLSDCSSGMKAALFLLAPLLVGGIYLFGTSSNSTSGGGPSSSSSGSSQSGAGSTPPPSTSTPPANKGPLPRPNPDAKPVSPADQQKMDQATRDIQKDLDQHKGPESWVPKINPTKGDGHPPLNCVEAAKAVDSTLAGKASAARPMDDGQNMRDLGEAYPGNSGQPMLGQFEIGERLLQAGPDSRGIVSVDTPTGAHTFNVYNDNGTVKWIDGQTGLVKPSAAELLQADGYPPNSNLEFLKTYPFP